MKRLIVLAALLSVFGTSFADQSVRGYTRKDGTYVQPYMRSSPDSQRWNNYSSQGNTNPYTGQRGYERNEFSNPPAYNNRPNTYSTPPTYSNPYENNLYNNPYNNQSRPSRYR